jgi:hypothetical protein
MAMTERSYRDLKGKLPGGRCLIVIGTEGNATMAKPFRWTMKGKPLVA